MSSYKILVIGAIHLGKKFKSYKSNPFGKVKLPLSELWTLNTLSYLLKVAENFEKDKLDEVVLLGDIIDNPRPEPEVVNYAKKIITTFSEVASKVSIIVGNHDTTSPQEDIASILPIFQDRNIQVYPRATYLGDSKFLYLPYYKKEDVIDTLKRYSGKDISVIVSHNDFYVNDTFIKTEMYKVDEVREIISSNPIFINGHIHNYYAEISNGIIYPGSVSPTSFKDDPQATGICYMEIDLESREIKKYVRFRNAEIIFITIDSKNHIPRLDSYLAEVKAKSPSTSVVLRYPIELAKEMEGILSKYPSLIVAHKPRVGKGEDVDSLLATYGTTQGLLKKEEIDTSIFEEVKKQVEKGLTLHEVKSYFQSFLKEKYGFSLPHFEV